MHEYQILLRRKADVAKINSGFKARRVYGNVYGLREFNGDETGFENKRFKNQATFLCEFNQAKLCEYLDAEFSLVFTVGFLERLNAFFRTISARSALKRRAFCMF